MPPPMPMMARRSTSSSSSAGHRGEARVAHVRVRDQALDLESTVPCRRRHDHEAILVEASSH